MNKIPRIAITGGPCGGKTTFLAEVIALLHAYGIAVIVVPEAATILINKGIAPWTIGLYEFQRRVLLASIRRERRYLRIAERIQAQGKRVVLLCDRGIPDCEGYVGRETYIKLLTEYGLHRHEVLSWYLMAVHLVTAADGAEHRYTLANNAARRETPEQARELDKATQHAWHGHAHHIVVDNTTDFTTKMQRAVRAFTRVLPMPIPLENERRFLIRNFTMDFIPREAAKIDIVQTYLRPPTEGERRVRAATHNGHTLYYYTHKIPTGTPGSAYEDQPPPITFMQYDEYLLDADPTRKPLLKTRYRFIYKGRTLEVDVYESEPWKSRRTVKLEVEMEDLSEQIELPPEWDVIEVTDDPQYLNSEMARAA